MIFNLFVKCFFGVFFSTTQIIRNFRIFRHAHLPTGIMGRIRHLVVRPRTVQTWKNTGPENYRRTFYFRVYRHIIKLKICLQQQTTQICIYVVCIYRILKKKEKHHQYIRFCFGIISPEYVVCQFLHVMTDKCQKVANIYHDGIQHRHYKIFPSKCGFYCG